MKSFTQWGEELPATTPKPEPARSGMIVHALYDISMYFGTPAFDRYRKAGDDDQARADALATMPRAIVQFYEVPEGENLFNV